MKPFKVVPIACILVLLMTSGCASLFDPRTTPGPSPATTLTGDATPVVTPTGEVTASPDITNTPSIQGESPVPTVTPSGATPAATTAVKDYSKVKKQLEAYLPPLDTLMRYFGLAEYAHIGKLVKKKSYSNETMYEFTGEFRDGSGIPGTFVVRYYINYDRGTITEMVMSNSRSGVAEVNSKLHNIVVLMLPIKQGETWKHKTTIDGKKYTVHAKITEVDGDKVKVRYEVPGVKDYYKDTYIEERTFEKGFGMTGFGNLMTGDLPISKEDAKDKKKLEQAIINHMFGYSLAKGELGR